MDRLDKQILVAVGFFLGAAAMLAVIAFSGNLTKSPLERIHKEYNYVMIFEDGSFEGETKDGQYERGCILEAPCND